METPEKSILGNSLTPVKPTDPPRTPNTSTDIAKNLQRITRILDENYKTWETEKKRSNEVIKAFGNFSNSSAKDKRSTEREDSEQFFKVVDGYCKKLRSFVLHFFEILDVVKKSLKELQAALALTGYNSEIRCKSWTLKDYIRQTERALQMIEEECKLKEQVMREIGHSVGTAKLELHRSVWEFSDPYLSLHLILLQLEI